MGFKAREFCPYLVADKKKQDCQILLLELLKNKLRGVKHFSSDLLVQAAVTFSLCHSLSTSSSGSINGRNIQRYVAQQQPEIQSLIRHLRNFQPDELRFTVELAIAVRDVLSRRHWDYEGWCQQKGTDAPLVHEHTAGMSILLPKWRLSLSPQRPGVSSIVGMRKFHSACLLAGAFCGLITPDQTGNKDISGFRKHGNYFGFQKLLTQADGVSLEKIKCIKTYFATLHKISNGSVTNLFNLPKMKEITTVERCVGHFDLAKHLKDLKATWCNSSTPLSEVKILRNKNIEDCDGCLHADFANKHLGGGVLGRGCVQEEIMFLSCPEVIPWILFCPALRDDEALIIQGVEKYVKHKGYAGTFKCCGPVTSGVAGHGGKFGQVPLDYTRKRRDTKWAVIDALNVSRHPGYQYRDKAVIRELMKCLTALKANLKDPLPENPKAPFATGNWGCGAFKNNPEVKFVIQWLAASKAGRKMYYVPFGDQRMNNAESFVQKMKKLNTVGALASLLFNSLRISRNNSVWPEMEVQIRKIPGC